MAVTQLLVRISKEQLLRCRNAYEKFNRLLSLEFDGDEEWIGLVDLSEVGADVFGTTI